MDRTRMLHQNLMRALIFATLALLNFTHGLSDGIYSIKLHDNKRCKGAYLGVKYVGGPLPLRPQLVTVPTAATAPKWKISSVGTQHFQLQPAGRAYKLAYNSQCTSPLVFLQETGYSKWKLTSLKDSLKEAFHIDAAQKVCSAVSATSGAAAKRLSPTDGTGSCSGAKVFLSTPNMNTTIASPTWTFIKAVPRSPKPINRPPPPAPLVVIEIPKVTFVFAFPGLTVETFGIEQQKLFCEDLVQASNYPPEQIVCSVDSVRPTSGGRQRRDLLAEDSQGGVTVDGSLTFTVTSADGVDIAQQSADAMPQLIEDPEELNTALEDVSGGGVTVVSVSTEQVKDEVPQTAPDTSTSPTPGNSSEVTLSPDTSPSATSPSPDQGKSPSELSPSSEPSPSPEPVPSPSPEPVPSPSPEPESPSPEPEPEPEPSPPPRMRPPPPEPPAPEAEPFSPPLVESTPPLTVAPPPESPPPSPQSSPPTPVPPSPQPPVASSPPPPEPPSPPPPPPPEPPSPPPPPPPEPPSPPPPPPPEPPSPPPPPPPEPPSPPPPPPPEPPSPPPPPPPEPPIPPPPPPPEPPSPPPPPPPEPPSPPPPPPPEPPSPPPPPPPEPPTPPPPPPPPPPLMSIITFTVDPCTVGTTDGYILFTVGTQGSTLDGPPTATCTSTDGGIAGTVVVTENNGVYTASASGLDSTKTYSFAVTVVTDTSTTTESSNSFVVGLATACTASAPIGPATAPVVNEPLQRTITWIAPTNVGAGEITSYLITCTTASSVSGTRTLTVAAPALIGIIGTGSPAGTNDQLLEGSVYTCSVAATKIYGNGPAEDASPFGTELFVTSLGTKGWWSTSTSICSNFGESSCTGTTRYLRGLVTSFPNNDYIGQGTTGYSADDDTVIAQYSIYFTNAYAGSTNGAVVVNGTNANVGGSDLHFYNTLSDGTPQSITPISSLLSADFKASSRVYYGIGDFTSQQTRVPTFVHNVFNPTSSVKYAIVYQESACSAGGLACNQEWITSNVDTSSGFIIRKQTAPTGWLCLDGTLNNACASVFNNLATWAASTGGAPVFAPESFVWGVGSNLGTYQRNAFVAYDWLSTTVLNLGAKINFDAQP